MVPTCTVCWSLIVTEPLCVAAGNSPGHQVPLLRGLGGELQAEAHLPGGAGA